MTDYMQLAALLGEPTQEARRRFCEDVLLVGERLARDNDRRHSQRARKRDRNLTLPFSDDFDRSL